MIAVVAVIKPNVF